MDFETRAMLVRAYRLEMKDAQPDYEPRDRERSQRSYMRRLQSSISDFGGDADYGNAAEAWDRHVYRQAPNVRRRMRLMGSQDYTEFGGLTRAQRRRAIAGGASYRATFGRR